MGAAALAHSGCCLRAVGTPPFPADNRQIMSVLHVQGALFCRGDLKLRTGGSEKQVILRSFWSLSNSPTRSKSGFKAFVCSNAVAHVFYSDSSEPDFGSKTG